MQPIDKLAEDIANLAPEYAHLRSGSPDINGYILAVVRDMRKRLEDAGNIAKPADPDAAKAIIPDKPRKGRK